MRNSLLGGLTVALAASGSVSASVWTITGASIAGVAQPVSSIRSGVIDISGGIQSALDQTFLFGPPPIVSFDSLNFLSFSDTSGTEYFGFYWVAAAQWQIQLTSSASGTPTLQTNMAGVSSTGGSFTSSSSGDSYFYLYQGVGVGSTVSITGTVPNSEIRWLDWDGAAWQVLGSGNTISNPNFALSNATMVPGGAGAALAATGLAGRLLGRRRGRACC